MANKQVTLWEPFVVAQIITPDEYLGNVIELLTDHRGQQINFNYVENSSNSSVHLKYKLPLSEIVTDFYAKLKSLTSGYASFEYQLSDYEPSDLVKVSYQITKFETN